MRLKPLAFPATLMISGLILGGISNHFFPVSSAQAETLSQSKVQNLVSSVTHGSAQVAKIFPGPGGLTAIVVEDQGHKTLAYATADGKYLILAQAIIDAEGNNVIKNDAETAGLIPKPMSPADIAQKVMQAKTFVLGTGGPEVIAFVDPNCIFCHKFYEDAKPLIAEGKLRVRYVISAFLKPSSEGKAAAILSASDPAEAMAKNEKGFDDATEEGGITADSNPNPAVVVDVQKNTELLQATGEVATPTLLYCGQGGTAKISHGMPQDLSSFVSSIGTFNSEGKCQ